MPFKYDLDDPVSVESLVDKIMYYLSSDSKISDKISELKTCLKTVDASKFNLVVDEIQVPRKDIVRLIDYANDFIDASDVVVDSFKTLKSSKTKDERHKAIWDITHVTSEVGSKIIAKYPDRKEIYALIEKSKSHKGTKSLKSLGYSKDSLLDLISRIEKNLVNNQKVLKVIERIKNDNETWTFLSSGSAVYLRGLEEVPKIYKIVNKMFLCLARKIK